MLGARLLARWGWGAGAAGAGGRGCGARRVVAAGRGGHRFVRALEERGGEVVALELEEALALRVEQLRVLEPRLRVQLVEGGARVRVRVRVKG